jgi:ATP-dependent Zn protease
MGTPALMVPALESNTGLVEMAVRPAARDHLLAWDASQRLVAIHEAGHAVAAAAAPTKIPVRVIDITLRHGGATMLGGAFEDTSLPWETQARMLDNLMVAIPA